MFSYWPTCVFTIGVAEKTVRLPTAASCATAASRATFGFRATAAPRAMLAARATSGSRLLTARLLMAGTLLTQGCNLRVILKVGVDQVDANHAVDANK